MLNRDLLISRYKQPFVDGINEANPYPDGHLMTLEDANHDSPNYLVHEDASEDFEHWLSGFYRSLFENNLEDRYTEPVLWPQDRALTLFNA